jgi:hypothetical protein
VGSSPIASTGNRSLTAYFAAEVESVTGDNIGSADEATKG